MYVLLVPQHRLDTEFRVTASFLQIYLEQLLDLLNPAQVRQFSITVSGKVERAPLWNTHKRTAIPVFPAV